MIDEIIEELTKLLVKQDLQDKKNNNVEKITISKVNLLKICIKVLKISKKSFNI